MPPGVHDTPDADGAVAAGLDDRVLLDNDDGRDKGAVGGLSDGAGQAQAAAHVGAGGGRGVHVPPQREEQPRRGLARAVDAALPLVAAARHVNAPAERRWRRERNLHDMLTARYPN